MPATSLTKRWERDQIEPTYLGKEHDPTGGPSSILRFLRYPAIKAGTSLSPNGAGARSSSLPISCFALNLIALPTLLPLDSDYGSLTLLFQSLAPSSLPSAASAVQPISTGLQILPPSSRLTADSPEWISVPFVPRAILVNVGDLLEFWSGGRFRSTVHRVRIPPRCVGMEGADKDSDEREAVEERYSMAFFCHPRPEARLRCLVKEGAKDVSASESFVAYLFFCLARPWTDEGDTGSFGVP